MFLIKVLNLPPLANSSHERLHEEIISAVSSLKIPGHRDGEQVKVFSQFNKHMLTSFDTDIHVDIKILEGEVIQKTTPRQHRMIGEAARNIVCNYNPDLNVYCYVCETSGISIP